MGHHGAIKETEGQHQRRKRQTFSCFTTVPWAGPDYGLSGVSKISPEAEAGRS